jgi:octaprenyl-diphosphate synthase
MLAGVDEGTESALHEYGLQLGYAFQIADDVLDYTADAATLGKNLGDDLAEGKATLPLIHAMQHSDATTAARLRAIVEQGEANGFETVLQAIRHCGSIDYALRRARGHADAATAALAGLDDNPWTAALRGLAAYAVERRH